MEIGPRIDRCGYIAMPLVKNVPYPRNDTWEKTTCQKCNSECWDRRLPPGFTEDMFAGKLCTMCALKQAQG